MNLKQLEYAAAVAERKSFSAAAQTCHVTQPTLSNGIAELEDEIGAKLFSRTTRSVGLTPLGEHLLPHIKEVLNARATIQAEARAFLNPARRMIRIGVSPLLDTALFGLILAPFKRANPDVEFVLREMNIADLIRLLDEGVLDYVCGASEGRGDRWNSVFLYDEPLLYIPGGAQATRQPAGPVSLKDIAHDTYVMVPDACGLSRATRALFRSQRRPLHEYSGQAMSYQVLEDWATLNIGSAILPRSKVSRNAKTAHTIRTAASTPARITFEAIWPKERARAQHFRAFEQHLKGVAPKILRGLPRSQDEPV